MEEAIGTKFLMILLPWQYSSQPSALGMDPVWLLLGVVPWERWSCGFLQ